MIFVSSGYSGTHGPGGVGQGAGDSIGKLLVVVGHGDEGHAHLGHIGIRVTFDHADRQHAGPPTLGIGHAQQVRHRCVIRSLAQDIDQQRRHFQCAGGLDRSTHHLHDQARATQRLCMGVDMRVGLVDRGDVGVVHHLRRYIAVHVQRQAYGHLGPYRLAHAAHQFAVRVGPGFRHGGAVQRQQHGIPGTVVADRCDDSTKDVLDRIRRDCPHGHQPGKEQRHQLHLRVFRGCGEEAGQRGLRAGVLGSDRIGVLQDAGASPKVQAGRDAGKGVGLVLETSRGNTDHRNGP